MNLLILAQLWIVFCVTHSVLIHPEVEAFFRKELQSVFRYYRLLYNFVSVISFILIVRFSLLIEVEKLFTWTGLEFVRYALIAIGIFFGIAGAKEYNMLYFAGIKQLSENDAQFPVLRTKGILSWVRHPFYTATFILLWSRDITNVSLTTNSILSLYLIVGTYIEEQKLIKRFGNDYIEYQKKVWMFLPIKKRNNKK